MDTWKHKGDAEGVVGEKLMSKNPKYCVWTLCDSIVKIPFWSLRRFSYFLFSYCRKGLIKLCHCMEASELVGRGSSWGEKRRKKWLNTVKKKIAQRSITKPLSCRKDTFETPSRAPPVSCVFKSFAFLTVCLLTSSQVFTLLPTSTFFGLFSRLFWAWIKPWGMNRLQRFHVWNLNNPS